MAAFARVNGQPAIACTCQLQIAKGYKKLYIEVNKKAGKCNS